MTNPKFIINIYLGYMNNNYTRRYSVFAVRLDAELNSAKYNQIEKVDF